MVRGHIGLMTADSLSTTCTSDRHTTSGRVQLRGSGERHPQGGEFERRAKTNNIRTRVLLLTRDQISRRGGEMETVRLGRQLIEDAKT
jgi:hypothetical protein